MSVHVSRSPQTPALAAEIFTLCGVSFPDSEDTVYLTARDKHTLAAVLALTPCGDHTFECAAHTAAHFRRQGIFSELLSRALEELPEESELLFYIRPTDEDSVRTMEAIGAEKISAEHMMELEKPAPHAPAGVTCPDDTTAQTGAALRGGIAGPAGTPALTVSAASSPEGEPELLYESEYGFVRIASRSRGSYLYGLEISEAERGKGHGTRFLSAVLSDLDSRGLFPVRLQVSGENTPAMALYKKTGFRIIETLLCYLY